LAIWPASKPRGNAVGYLPGIEGSRQLATAAKAKHLV
jgi:hypothetical protein